MSLTLKKDVWKVKDPSSGNYRGAAILSTTLPEDVAALVDDVYDQLNNTTDGVITVAQGIVNTLQTQQQTLISAIDSALQGGTDDTITQADWAADAKAVGDALKADLAAEYVTSGKAYAVGDYCLHNNQLYRCITAIGTAGEAWTSGHWTQVPITNDVNYLKNALEGKTQLFDSDNPDVRKLYVDVSNSEIKSASTDRLVVVPIKENTVYEVSCGGVSIKRIATTVSDPANNIAASNVKQIDGAVSNYTVANTTGKYLVLQLFIDTDSDKTPSNYYSSIVINENTAKDSLAREGVLELKNALNAIEQLNPTALQFENGTYQAVSVGSTLTKYDGGGYLNTRKRLSTVVFDALADVRLTAKTGYVMNIYTAVDGVITVRNIEQTSFTLEAGKEYGIVLKTTGGTDDISAVPISSIVDIEYDQIVDKTLSVSGQAADAKTTGDKISRLDSILYKEETIDLTSAETKNSIIASGNGKWSSNTGNFSYFIPVSSNGVKLIVTAGEIVSVVALLKSDTAVNNTYPDYATGGSRITIPAGETQTFVIPSDCNYACIIKSAGSTSYAPASVVYVKQREFDVAVIPLGLHEKPANEYILNIIKRCRQMTDIKWTPAVDLQRYMLVQLGGADIPDTANTQNYLGKFKAGVEYKGVPYGRVAGTVDNYGYAYGTVGHYIGFDTFISSIVNPKSRLSKANVGSLSGHRSVIYATVCSGLTCYALNVSEVSTASIVNISGLTLIGKLNDDGTLLSDSLIKIGDVLNKYNYHTAIITDIIRDGEGLIQFVELSDASTAGLADRNYDDGQIGGICRRKGWTREQLFAAGSWGDYSVYRYTKNVPYTPSPYVNVGDEFDGWRIEHFPIMPYEGQGFVYKTGYIPNNAVKLVITLDGYAYVKVFKDGTEIGGSPFAVTTTNDEIDDISVTEIGAGEYTAYLCNITDGNVVNMSYACKWTIEASE